MNVSLFSSIFKSERKNLWQTTLSGYLTVLLSRRCWQFTRRTDCKLSEYFTHNHDFQNVRMLTNRRNSMQTEISRWAKRNVHKTVRQRTSLPQKFMLRKRHADASEYSHAEDRWSGKFYDDTMALQIGHEASGGDPQSSLLGFFGGIH